MPNKANIFICFLFLFFFAVFWQLTADAEQQNTSIQRYPMTLFMRMFLNYLVDSCDFDAFAEKPANENLCALVWMVLCKESIVSGTTLLHFPTSNRRLPGRTHKTSELRRRGDTPISIILLWKFISILQESCECFPFFDSHRFHMCVSNSVFVYRAFVARIQ